jgi:radical SAM superfamily enzyme YgiQ (UPF0313 family)
MAIEVDRLHRALKHLRDYRLHLYNPTFANPPWEKASPRVLILRLSSFADVERSTPHLFLAAEVRRGCPSAYIDMAFLPEKEDVRVLEEAGLPLILGTQSHSPLEFFDLVLVSNSYLLELVNLPFLFSRSGVPTWASQRDGKWPPVILGGSNASASHAVVSDDGDCMVDAVFFGEGEGAVARMAEELSRASTTNRKARLVEMAARIDGLWAARGGTSATGGASEASGDSGDPGSPATHVHRARCDVALASAEPLLQPVLPGAEATTARLSITLGCPCLCSFCFEGNDRRPFREIPAEALIVHARALKRETGAGTIELCSFNFNTHSELAELLIQLHRLFLRVNLMSQRVDILARTPGLLDLELAADKRSFTLGIEGISARQRRFLHKSLADADVARALEALHGRRVREVKLFYILTGQETEEDFAEFAGFVKWLKETRRKVDAPPRMVFSFGLLVRMPFTPLRYDPPLLSEATWRPLAGRAKSVCETNGFEFRLSHQWPEYAATQVLGSSHPSLADFLVGLAGKGCISSEGLPPEGRHAVEEWIRERAGQLQGEKPQDHVFAFSFLETEGSRRALYRQYLAAQAGRDEGHAAGVDPSKRSGVSPESIQQLAGTTQAKHRLEAVPWQVLFAREAAELGSEWKDSWLLRRLLALCPGQTENVLSVKESLIAPSVTFGVDTAWFGKSVAAVTAWDQQSFAQAVRSIPELFGGEARAFAPGMWKSLSVSLSLPAPYFPDALERLAAFLRDAHAPVTIRRNGDSLVLEVPDKSARKRAVLAGKASRTDGGVRLDLVIGAKLRLGDYLGSFGMAARRCVVVEISLFD